MSILSVYSYVGIDCIMITDYIELHSVMHAAINIKSLSLVLIGSSLVL